LVCLPPAIFHRQS